MIYVPAPGGISVAMELPVDRLQAMELLRQEKPEMSMWERVEATRPHDIDLESTNTINTPYMNTGEQTIEWLYTKQLQVDKKWSIRTAKGFTWWPYKHAQTIEIIGEELHSDGDTEYLISVRTDLLKNIELSNNSLSLLNMLMMPIMSMAGPVYDKSKNTLTLCSLVKIHNGNRDWMEPLISFAAVLQMNEANKMSFELAKTFNAKEAISGHPINGERTYPDEMMTIVDSLITPAGRNPCNWTEKEFAETVKNYMQKPPSLGATSGGLGFTVEFPYGEESSLFQVVGDEHHPKYGNGLFMKQTFPVEVNSDIDGFWLAITFNTIELKNSPFGYGFGSYVYQNRMLHFISFLPNALYRNGLLVNIYYSSAIRAGEISDLIAGSEWTKESFDLKHSTLGRITDRSTGG